MPHTEKYEPRPQRRVSEQSGGRIRGQKLFSPHHLQAHFAPDKIDISAVESG